jgi:hypothetical protein
MADNHDLVKCPLCEGHGEVRVRKVLQLLRDQTLASKIERGLCEEATPEAEPTELVTVVAPAFVTRDFQRDVHSWNPQLPMWRRSPKE